MVSKALDKLIYNIGVMIEIITNGAKELDLAEWGETFCGHHV